MCGGRARPQRPWGTAYRGLQRYGPGSSAPKNPKARAVVYPLGYPKYRGNIGFGFWGVLRGSRQNTLSHGGLSWPPSAQSQGVSRCPSALCISHMQCTAQCAWGAHKAYRKVVLTTTNLKTVATGGAFLALAGPLCLPMHLSDRRPVQVAPLGVGD